jgi:hypothetical protein
MNGTGAADQAATTSSSLGALGFHMVGVGDTQSTGDVSETVVYYGSRSPATEAAAEEVANSISGSVAMAYDPSQVADGAQVTVVTGSQFAVNSPSTPATGSSGAPTTTVPSTPTTTAPTSSAIEAPNSSTSSLEPWDPRACPANATPTAPVANQT